MRSIAYILTKALLRLWSLLPLRVHYALADFFLIRLGLLTRYRRDTVVVNMARCFRKETYWTMIPMYKDFYRHFADILAETIWFGGCSRHGKRLHEKQLVEIVNPEVVNEAYDSSPSVMLLCSHSGNWELIGGVEFYDYSGKPFCIDENNICVVYRKLKSNLWNRLMRANRLAVLSDINNPGYIESKNLVRYAFTHSDEKKVYHVITDQRPYYAGSGNMVVKFMDMECRTMSAAAQIASKCKMSVLYMRMYCESRGHYRIEYVPICNDASKMSSQDIMQKYYDLLGEDIRKYPSNYLWTHRRWV